MSVDGNPTNGRVPGRSQAAIGWRYSNRATEALRAVTSVPAKAIDLDYRIGYVRPGYDADIVVWDDLPLSIGATPVQVFIDGVPQLDSDMVVKSMGHNFTDPLPEPVDGASTSDVPKASIKLEKAYRNTYCGTATKPNQQFIVTGIKRSFLQNYPELAATVESAGGPLTLVIDGGLVRCLGSSTSCAEAATAVQGEHLVKLDLEDGYLLPGLTAVTSALGMAEILFEPDSTDGEADPLQDSKDPGNLSYAKYGVMLEGKGFTRARMGGVTRAISPPLRSVGLVAGVSVGILTGGHKNLLDGGVFQGDVALHVAIDANTKVGTGTVSNAIKTLREIVISGQGVHNGTVYGQVAKGKLPLVVGASNQVS